MFAPDPLSRNRPVIRLVLLRQRMPFAFLLRGEAVEAHFHQSLIPTIRKTGFCGGKHGSALLEKCEVLLFAFTKGGGKDFAARFVGDHLGFLGVTLLFAAVVSLLFFLGRSQGHSVASIKTISNTVSLSRNTFLPGR